MKLQQWCFTCEQWTGVFLGVSWHFILHPFHKRNRPKRAD